MAWITAKLETIYEDAYKHACMLIPSKLVRPWSEKGRISFAFPTLEIAEHVRHRFLQDGVSGYIHSPVDKTNKPGFRVRLLIGGLIPPLPCLCGCNGTFGCSLIPVEPKIFTPIILMCPCGCLGEEDAVAEEIDLKTVEAAVFKETSPIPVPNLEK